MDALTSQAEAEAEAAEQADAVVRQAEAEAEAEAAAVVDAVVVQAEARAGNSRIGCCGDSRLRQRQASTAMLSAERSTSFRRTERRLGRRKSSCSSRSGRTRRTLKSR